MPLSGKTKIMGVEKATFGRFQIKLGVSKKYIYSLYDKKQIQFEKYTNTLCYMAQMRLVVGRKWKNQKFVERASAASGFFFRQFCPIFH